MKTTLSQLTSALASTPRWSHWLLPSLLLLFAIYRVWQKWPLIGGLIARRKGELSELGEPPSEKRWSEWKRLLPGTSVSEKKRIRLVLSLAGAVALLAGSYWQGHRVGYHLGYVEGQWELTRNRYTYTDVLVVERDDDQDFLLRPARMASWNAHTCAPTDWLPGQKMQVLTYQQKLGCKDVAGPGAFEFYTKQGKRIIFREEIANAGY